MYCHCLFGQLMGLVRDLLKIITLQYAGKCVYILCLNRNEHSAETSVWNLLGRLRLINRQTVLRFNKDSTEDDLKTKLCLMLYQVWLYVVTVWFPNRLQNLARGVKWKILVSRVFRWLPVKRSSYWLSWSLLVITFRVPTGYPGPC